MRALLATTIAIVGLAAVAIGAGCGGGTPSPAAPSAPASDAGEGTSKIPVPAHIREAVDAADRDPDDRKLDAGRHPAELLAFFDIKPGMKVAELGAAGGYTAELLARSVGPSGVVYGQNSQWLRDRFVAKPWAARLAKLVNKNVVDVNRDFDDPLPPEVSDLDAVLCVLFYHDLFWTKTDRVKFNASVFRALKHGGVFGVVDHSGRPGTDATEVETIHRIEEKVVREEIEKAGFKLAAEADFLRNPNDTRDWNAAPGAAGGKRGSSDRFVLKFVKP